MGPYTLAMDALDVRAVSHVETQSVQPLRHALGVEGEVPRKSRLLLVNSQPARHLLVDAVLGLRDVEGIAVQRLPALMQGHLRTPWLLGLGELAGTMLLLVDPKRLGGEGGGS